MPTNDDQTHSSAPPVGATATSHTAPAEGSEGTQVQRSAPTYLLQPDALPAIPGYTVAREVARGGMGVVYAAHDPTCDREVAVKVMHPDQDAGRFVVEVKTTAQLPHPGVPPVYALGALADGRPFLAMKLIEGRTLADELKTAEVPRLLDIFQHVCQTVGFAHARGIVHRDLKPANVMVGNFGEVLVMDWGLAKRVSGMGPVEGAGDTARLIVPRSAGETVAGEVKGTPAYMAPEQARGEPVGARADVFALGGILAVVLTGRPPFLGESVHGTVLMAALGDVSACFGQLDACAADPELVAVAKKCLAPNPADRYADGEEVARAVGAFQTGVEERLRRAERERAASAAEALEQRKRRKVQLALFGALALLAGGVGAFAWWRDKQVAERKLADERAEGERLWIEGERKAAEARAETEREFKVRQARQGIATNLKLSADLRKQYRFKATEAALAQAAELAKGGARELLPEVERARADLALVVRLDDIRYRKWVWVTGPDGKVDYDREAAAVPKYRKAFADAGLDPAAPDAVVVERIAASSIRAELVAALDDWALYEQNEAARNRLLEVASRADRADRGPWIDRVRNPALWKDKAALAKLAAEIDWDTAPPAAVSVLAALMQRADLSPASLLTTAHFKHPTDYDLAFVLAMWHLDRDDGLDLGPLEAARALRPDNTYVLLIIGATLETVYDDPDAALLAYEQVITLDPGLALAHANKGAVLAQKGEVRRGTAELRLAIKIDPTEDTHHGRLGEILLKTGDIPGAREELTIATRIAPQRWGAKLAKLSPLDIAPPPRPVDR
jgi:hypothetical protein